VKSGKRVGRGATNATHNDGDKNQMETEKTYIVTTQSAISYRQCLLGQGSTKEEAMTDAFGPRPWPRSARNADCYEVTREELDVIENCN